MRTVSTAEAYNAGTPTSRRSRKYEPGLYSTPPPYSDIFSPSTTSSPSSSRPLLSPSKDSPQVPSPTKQRSSRSAAERYTNSNNRALHSPALLSQGTSPLPTNNTPGSGSNTQAIMNPTQQHSNFHELPPPPPQGYHMDDRHQDTSYGGYDGSSNGGYSGGYDHGYVDGHDHGYAEGYDHPSNSSLRDNHFNRNSYYDNAAYPEISPSPARLSRPEFDNIDPSSIADDDDPSYTHDRRASGRQRLSKVPIIGAAAAGGSAYSAVGQGGSTQMLNGADEKAAWRQQEDMDRRRRKKWIWLGLAVLAVLAVAGGVTGGILGTRKSSGSSKSSSSAGMSSDSDGLTADSAEIKGLMKNPNLHKVFPVMDYTPYKTQYPDCLGDPPSQDNVTMDMAILSQLTGAVRVYGTDCKQTELILTAIDRLNMNDTMKVWLGVWIDNNQTTSDRQMSQMYDILKKYPQDHFVGVIIGNEALFRKDITETSLVTLLGDVKSNFTQLGYNLSVSTSDLGSSWTTALAAASDHVMGNIHPFFAGVPSPQAAGWTYTFWQTNDVAVAPEPANAAAGSIPRNIISETGWPSGGGNDCGVGATCTGTTDGSVAGITQMNQFMGDWICQANANNTMYFWFEAFDEPWKAIYNTPTEQWEDKWGLMTIDRKIKPGVQIPDCGGKTV